MQPYITFVETNDKGELIYYILQKSFPNYLAYISTTRVEKALAQATVAGYNMQVVFCGTIQGAFIPSYRGVVEQIQLALEDMANWFLSNRINLESKKYLKFKLNVDRSV
jgi:hypothetical protein